MSIISNSIFCEALWHINKCSSYVFGPFWLLQYIQGAFPTRDELLSDLSDDDMQLDQLPEILKPTVLSFKPKDDTDLFGLGIQEEAHIAKDSSDEQEGKKLNMFPKHTACVTDEQRWTVTKSIYLQYVLYLSLNK